MVRGKDFHLARLVGLNPRAQNILDHFNNGLLIREYDEMGRPLCHAPNGKQAIFCVAPDFSWQGWMVLDDDVRFEEEEKRIHDIMKSVQENPDG